MTKRMEYTTALIFGMVAITDKHIDIDGYSNARTLGEMFREMADAVEAYDINEAYALRSASRDGLKEQYRVPAPSCIYSSTNIDFVFDWEDVAGASNAMEEHIFGSRRADGRKVVGYEVVDNTEYADARRYVRYRFAR